MTKFASLCLFLACLSALGGCNTVAGAGEDMTDAGHSVTNAAEKSK